MPLSGKTIFRVNFAVLFCFSRALKQAEKSFSKDFPPAVTSNSWECCRLKDSFSKSMLKQDRGKVAISNVYDELFFHYRKISIRNLS